MLVKNVHALSPIKPTFPMARSKSDLPSKVCPVCQRPFTWRKKWAKCWDEVKYCSDRCRRRRQQAAPVKE